MKHKFYLIATALIFVAVSLLGIKTNAQVTDQYSFKKTYKVTSPVDLDISTSGGNISTIAEEGNSIEVAFIVSQRGKILNITFEQLKDYAEVEISNGPSNLSIHIKKMYERNVSVGFSIKTPSKTSATLATSGGNLKVNGLTGKQSLNTSGGNISLENLAGNVTARTSGGNISINQSSADFYASTSGGNISLNNITGKLEVSTSGGNINVENISKGLLAKTSGGNIQVNNAKGDIDVYTSGGSVQANEIVGSLKAGTSGGGIRVEMEKLTSRLELRTSGGSINVTIPAGLGLDLDLSASNINTQLTNFSGTSKKDRVKGQMNGGGIPVNISTSGGNINLNYK